MILSGSTPSCGKVFIHSGEKKNKKKPWIEKEWERGSGKCKDTGKNSKRGYTPEAWKRK